MLSDQDRRRIKEQFAVDDDQVRRDHLISHVLAALSHDIPEMIRFFGGTALSRSFLTNGRLSEDIDLIAVAPRLDVADAITRTLARRMSREFGRPTFTPALAAARQVQPVTVSFPSGVSVQLQLLPEDHYPSWPFESKILEQRYSDCDGAVLEVPTQAAFVAWKTSAFIDRRAARDLWDLAALADSDAFSEDAAALFTRFGPSTSIPSGSMLPVAPTEDVWRRELAHQTRLTISAQEARAAVIRSWAQFN